MDALKSKLEIRDLNKLFQEEHVLKDINFHLLEGEFLSILGPSGCGKTTLIKILIGVEKFNSGMILKDGEDISNLDVHKRKMGMVFQNYALFPTMTVRENIEYALKFDKELKFKKKEIADNLIKKIGLEEHENKKPNSLSGGQQQRVAIARTLALNPDIILFDEPMSALDQNNRVLLREVIKNVQKEFNISIIYITHDQEEAFTMSDRIIIMSEGQIEQIDTPKNIMKNPKNDYIKEFVLKQVKYKIDTLKEFIYED